MYFRSYCVISRLEEGTPNERYPNPLWYMDFVDLDGGMAVQATLSSEVVDESGVLKFVSGEGQRQIVVVEFEGRLRERDRAQYSVSIRSMKVTPFADFDAKIEQTEKLLERARQAQPKAS